MPAACFASPHPSQAPWLAFLLGCWMISGCAGDASPGDDDSDDAGSADSSQPPSDENADGGVQLAERSCEAEANACDEFGDERPPRLSEHSAVYDPERLEMIVFGGTPTIPEDCSFGGPTDFESQTWIYSDPCNQWLKVDSEGPPAGGRHSAVWAQGSLWLFGGRFRPEDETGLYTLYDEFYRFDVAERRWSRMPVEGQAPSARVNAAMAYDTKRQRLWMFGGNNSPDGLVYGPLNDLWFFDLKEQRWESRGSGEDPPPPRLFHNMVYDSKRDALVVFGGTSEQAPGGTFGTNGLWAVGIDDGQWRQLGGGGDEQPDTRFWSSLVYDSQDDSYLLFGGHDDTDLGNRNDIWRFRPDDNRWELMTTGDEFNKPANGVCDFPPDFADVRLDMPERRNAHAFVWSEPCQHSLVFGGKTDCGAIDDVWELDGRTWTERLGATEGEACLRWREEPERCGDMCF